MSMFHREYIVRKDVSGGRVVCHQYELQVAPEEVGGVKEAEQRSSSPPWSVAQGSSATAYHRLGAREAGNPFY
jgi:hypothetical protein